MTPREYIAQLKAQWPVAAVSGNDVSQHAETLAAKVGRTLDEWLHDINEMDYAQHLLRILTPRLPAEVALLFEEGTLAVGTLGRRQPDAYVKEVGDEGYAIVFHTGVRDLIYRVTRILATRMYAHGQEALPDEPDLAETSRLIAEVFWWYQETGAAFGPDYPISDDQIMVAGYLTQEAGVLLLAHEIGHVLDAQSEGALDHLTLGSPGGQLGHVIAQHRGEFTADVIGAHLALGVGVPAKPPYPSAPLYTYAGIELALRIHQALEEVGFEFTQSHPPASKRLAHIRSIIQAGCEPDIWSRLSSLAGAIDVLMSNVVRILLDPTEHNAFFEQQAANIAREFHTVLEQCSRNETPDYWTFYRAASDLFSRGYSHQMLEHIAAVAARFFEDLAAVGSAQHLDETLLKNIRKGKLIFGFIHDLKEPARSIFMQAFRSHAPHGAANLQ